MTAAAVPLSRRGTGGRWPDPRPFALQPLLDAAEARCALPRWDSGTFRGFEGWSTSRAALLLGIDRRQVYRWRDLGLTAYQADELACRLGLHPSEVWGRDWWTEASD